MISTRVTRNIPQSLMPILLTKNRFLTHSTRPRVGHGYRFSSETPCSPRTGACTGDIGRVGFKARNSPVMRARVSDARPSLVPVEHHRAQPPVPRASFPIQPTQYPSTGLLLLGEFRSFEEGEHDGERVYNPMEPLVRDLKNFGVADASAAKKQLNETLIMRLTVPAHSQSWGINISPAEHEDFSHVLFHFNPRRKFVAMNDRRDNIWGQQVISRSPVNLSGLAAEDSSVPLESHGVLLEYSAHGVSPKAPVLLSVSLAI